MNLTLPWPPATNNLYSTVKSPKGLRRIPTRRYKAWLADAEAALSQQRWTPHVGSFRATLFFVRPDNRRRDLDGLAKAPLDLLVKVGAISDDSLAQTIHLAWAWDATTPGGSVSVTIEPAEFPIFIQGKAA